MQAGELVNSDVRALTSRVLVRGTARDHVSWSVDRELSGDLPDQVVAGSGITQATGTIVFSGEQILYSGLEVESASANPWNKSAGWMPKPGDKVQILAGDGTTEWVQFTGRIDKVTGSIGGQVQASIIDEHDRLSARFSHEPLLRIMPPMDNGDPYRSLGLSSTYYVDAALRKSRIYSTPSAEANLVLSVPAQSSLWPEFGRIQTATVGGTSGDTSPSAGTHLAPWGIAMSDFETAYTTYEPKHSGVPVQVTMCVAPNHAGVTSVVVSYGEAVRLRIYVYANRGVQAYLNNTSVAVMSLGDATIFTVLFRAGEVTIRSNTGGESTGTAVIPGAIMSTISFTADQDSRVAGMQASHPATVAQQFASLNHSPSAIIESKSEHIGVMDAGPAIIDRAAEDLLKEISESTLTGMWIDELGMFRWVPTLRLRSQAVSKTLATLDDILSLDWESSMLGLRSTVTLSTQRPVVSKGRWRNKTLYEGSGETLESGDVTEDFIGPATDEDWIMPDESLTILDESNWSLYNRGRDSVAGVFYESNGEVVDETGLSTTITLEKLGIKNYKITHRAGTFPTDVTARLATSPASPGLWQRNKDKPLPWIPGYGKVTWMETSRTPITAGGDGPELVHNAGYWNNREDSFEVIDRIGAYLAAQTSLPSPTITGLEVVYDPRTQLGDVVNIQSPSLLGVTMRALVVAVSNSADSGGASQTLSVRIISTTITHQTYRAYNNALTAANLTYAQWDALGPSPHTYEQFNDAG